MVEQPLKNRKSPKMNVGIIIIGQSIKRGEKNKIYHVYHKRKIKRDTNEFSHTKGVSHLSRLTRKK